jgi:hypothetical protein
MIVETIGTQNAERNSTHVRRSAKGRALETNRRRKLTKPHKPNPFGLYVTEMWFKHEGAFVHIISFILIASATTAAVAYQLPARGMSTASQPALTTAVLAGR